MLFGIKEEFAIEFEVKEFYHDKRFIGDGFFVVYIDGFMYGIKEDDATSFNAIIGTLKDLMNSMYPEKNLLDKYDDFELCDKYYDNYRDIKRYSYDETKYFVDSYNNINNFIEEWAQMEEAFDNGCFVLQLNETEYVRLLGFNTLSDGSYDIEDVHGVIIPKEKYLTIIQSVIQELERCGNM